MIRSLLVASESLHSQGILHKDFKPHNVLIDADVQGLGSKKIIIADFGLSENLRDLEY